jgi:hypothetical protein
MENIKKGKLNYDQLGRAYPDEPQIKENWNCIWEYNNKYYKLVGDDEYKEWEEVTIMSENTFTKKQVETLIGKTISSTAKIALDWIKEETIVVDTVNGNEVLYCEITVKPNHKTLTDFIVEKMKEEGVIITI